MSQEELDAPLVPPASGLIGFIVRYKRHLFYIGLVWFALVLGGGLYLSTIDARTGLHVFGSNTWTAGHTSALRVSLRDLRLNMNRPIEKVEVQFVDVSGQAGPTYILDQKVQGFVQGTVQAPTKAGRWTLHFRASHEGTPLTARLALDVLPRLRTSQSIVQKTGPPRRSEAKAKTERLESGPITLHVDPLDGVLPSGLPGKLILTARRGDAPAAAEVYIKVHEGRSDLPIAERVSVPPQGFTIIPVHAVHPVFHFELTTSDSRANRRIHPVSTQFSIDVPSSIVQPGPTEVTILSLHRNGSIFIDLWRGNQWLSTTTTELADGRSKMTITIPSGGQTHDLVWLQVYRHAYMPGSARDGRYLLVTDGDRAQIANWLLEKAVAQHGMNGGQEGINDGPLFSSFAAADTAETNSIRALLGRLPRPEHSPPLLADSGETVIQTVSDLKATWQIRFVIALVASGVIMFLIVGLLLYQNQREVERGWALAGGADDGTPGTRKRLALEAGYLFVVLAIFLLGMIQLMLSIRW